MGFYEHATAFAGFPVVDWDAQRGIADPAHTAYRIGLTYLEEEGLSWTDRFAAFLDDPAAGQVAALVVGPWDLEGRDQDSSQAVEALASARERLPNLQAIFLGDIISEEYEVSWINQSDVSPLFQAYPALQHFTVRGSSGLALGRIDLPRLQSLTIQCGGLPASVLADVKAAHLPELTHLELYLGEEGYGAEVTIGDLAPILAGDLFPQLRYLGLRDSEMADQIAAAVAQAPVVERIRVLDLSLGTLTDEGAAALLASPAIARLEKLDVHHHFCSTEMVERLQGLGIDVDASDPQDEAEDEEDPGERWRYVAVGE